LEWSVGRRLKFGIAGEARSEVSRAEQAKKSAVDGRRDVKEFSDQSQKVVDIGTIRE
jgi:hypothetical protein